MKRAGEREREKEGDKKKSITGKNLSSFNALMSMFPAVVSE